MTPRWTVRAEASHASSSYVYRYDSRAVQEERRGNGAVTTLQASAARALVHTANGTRVEASLVGGVQRLSVQQSPPCGPPAMSQPPCLFSAEDWQRTYTVPFGGVAVGTSHPISARLAGDARVSYTLGRANTEAFWVDLLPQYDAYEADRHHWLRTVSATLGLTIGL